MTAPWTDQPGAVPPTAPSTPPEWGEGAPSAPPDFGAPRPSAASTSPPATASTPARVGARVWVVAAAIVIAGLAVAVVLLLTRRGETTTAASGPTTTSPTTAPGGASVPSTAPSTSAPPASTPPSTAPGSSAPAPAATQAELDAAVRELRPFVERERGAALGADVPVVAVDDAAFDEAAVAASGPWRDELIRRAKLLVPLTDLPQGVDAAALVDRQLAAAVAVYDPAAGRIVVRRRPVTPVLRAGLVRSLTRALDHQQLAGAMPAVADRQDEAAVGLESLLAGDAERVASAWAQSLPVAERQSLDREAASIRLPATEPPTFSTFAAMPATAGRGLVESILANGGAAALDRALREPPVTSAQVLHPEQYLARQAPTPVPVPQVDGDPVDRGTFGEALLTSTLAAATDDQTAAEAAGGWRGDAYVTWEDRERGSCIRIDVETGDAGRARTLRAALDTWAQRHPGAEVTARGATGVTVTSCQPSSGGGARSPL